jgi:transposase
MPFTLVPDELWQAIQPLLPVERPKPKGGRPTADNRSCLTVIVFVLRTGCPWNLVPYELAGVSGVTCWRRFQEWTQAGVWSTLHRNLLNRLGILGKVDLSLAPIDSASIRAVFGGTTRVPTRRTEGKMAASAI